MRDKLQLLIDRFGALSTRERMFVLIAVFAVSYQIADLVVLDRQYQRIETLNRDIAHDNAAIVGVNTDMNMLAAQAERDPNRALREQLAAARSHNAVLQQRLTSVAEKLISPQAMARFIEKLLVQESELTMLSLKTLKTEPLLPARKQEGSAEPVQKSVSTPAVTLHKHGFEITFSGGYLPTLRYLQALEALPWEFFWDSVNYEVIDYPNSIVRLRLHTLSLSEDWIGV